jgi:hypothetical protein
MLRLLVVNYVDWIQVRSYARGVEARQDGHAPDQQQRDGQ